jgi:hypothetical protein
MLDTTWRGPLVQAASIRSSGTRERIGFMKSPK